MYTFDTPASRDQNGNMKGGMERALPPGAVLLAGAEMDYPTAPCIRRALADFVQNGLYGFTLPDAAYLNSIVHWTRIARNQTITPEYIVPTLGTVMGLSAALRAFTHPGDGVVIQHPSYYRFDRAVRRNGRRVISNPLREENGVYSLDFADLEAKLALPEAKMLLLCNPHNPTGKVFSAQELEHIAQLSARYDVLVFSDEIFAETAQPGHEVPLYALLDPQRGITSTSLGKTFNLTGVNHANLLIPNEKLRQIYLAQQKVDHFGSIDPFFYTALRAAYTEEGLAWVRAMNAHTLRLYETLKQALLPYGLTLSPLEGGFVTWLDCRRLGLSDAALQHFFERQALVYADPGTEYGPGGSGFMRLNVATTASRMDKAIAGIIRALRG